MYLRRSISRRDHERMINARAGKEHYKLLAYLSNAFGGRKTVELGTHRGTGSLAPCHNKNTCVETWDLTDYYWASLIPNNLKRRTGNVITEDPKSLLEASLTFLDTNHDGSFEVEILGYLRKNN